MKLEDAVQIAERVKTLLAPECEKIVVAGSIRRRRPVVNDVDLVLIPKDWLTVVNLLRGLGSVSMSGKKITRVTMDDGTRLDVYYATPENFTTLLLIRTGSVQNNIRICDLAKKKGWHLFANGSGLFNERGERIAGDSEESIYKALGLIYQEPWDRE